MTQKTAFSRHIKNVVYVMFENRSFDTLLGWLYDGDPNPQDVNSIPSNPDIKFIGLTDKLLTEFAQPLKKHGKPGHQDVHDIVRGVRGNFLPFSTPIADPHETFRYVTNQIYTHTSQGQQATMKGFLQDFYSAHPSLPIHHEILQTYDFSEAPIINTLAYHYGVSDEWFCSIPSQTSINRAFSLIGDSVGYRTEKHAEKQYTTAMVNNSKWGGPFNKNPAPFIGKTIWNVLHDNGHTTDKDWKIYYSDRYLAGLLGHKTSYTYLMFDELQKLLNPCNAKSFTDPRYQSIDCFYEDAKNGTLPRFSYLEPRYTWEEYAGLGIHGNDYHPPSDIRKGEQFLADIYNCLKASPQWEDTLLIVAFDEHGGTFDHIEPPSTAIDPGGANINECHFDFKRFGVRVPMLFISPWVTKHTVIRSDKSTPFDHTSWLATLLQWYGLDPACLGKRTAVAPTFEKVISDQNREPVELPDLADYKPRLPIKDNGVSLEMAKLLSDHLKAAKPDIDHSGILKKILKESHSEESLYRLIRGFLSK